MSESTTASSGLLAQRHLAFGWWVLLTFLVLGGVLEALHGFKVSWYLAVGNETRRLMWTLAHAHGALLGIVNIAFALTIRALAEDSGDEERSWTLPSSALLAATVFIPGGFFLGGTVVYGGDPGRGILLLPVGAVALFAAVFAIALRASRSQ